MAELSSFFNSARGDERRYDAARFAEYFNQFIRTGLYHRNEDAGLGVSAGAQMNVVVAEGSAFIEGYMYKNTEPLELNVPLADEDRIDRIVIRLDLNEDGRYIKAFVKHGEGDEPPELQRDEWIYEMSLAQVKVIGGQSYIESEQITDERYDKELCGLAWSLLDVNVADFMEHFEDELQKFRDEYSNVENYPIATKAQAESGTHTQSYMNPRRTADLIEANKPTQKISTRNILDGTKQLTVTLPSDATGIRVRLKSLLNFTNITGNVGGNASGWIRVFLRNSSGEESGSFSRINNSIVSNNDPMSNIGTFGGWFYSSSSSTRGFYKIDKTGMVDVQFYDREPSIGYDDSTLVNNREINISYFDYTMSHFQTNPNATSKAEFDLIGTSKTLVIEIPQSATPAGSTDAHEVDCSFRTGSLLEVWAFYDDWRF